jgi:hypothetical protein
MRIKRIVVVLGLIAMGLIFMGANSCESQSKSDKLQRERTDILMDEADRVVGMPNITYFQQRKLMKQVIEMADKENLICYVYIKSDYQGKLMFIGKSMGFGVPFSAQFTNPMKIAASGSSSGYAILPQPDPNGLFMPTSSSATWILMIDPETKKGRPVYIEPEIVVSPFPLHDETTG